jgi:hypothetical protein
MKIGLLADLFGNGFMITKMLEEKAITNLPLKINQLRQS